MAVPSTHSLKDLTNRKSPPVRLVTAKVSAKYPPSRRSRAKCGALVRRSPPRFTERVSSKPGAMDAQGAGLFRGRFGTTAAAHSSGAPVILFPFRYWDRWQPRADAPELAYFTLSVDQPSAWWESFFYDKEDTESARLGVLARFDPEAPWDADPEDDPRLRLEWRGDAEGKTIPIGKQSDRVDWRVFVRYDPGAFDPKTGMAHGWRQTPLLKRLGAFYFGPPTVLASVER